MVMLIGLQMQIGQLLQSIIKRSCPFNELVMVILNMAKHLEIQFHAFQRYVSIQF